MKKYMKNLGFLWWIAAFCSCINVALAQNNTAESASKVTLALENQDNEVREISVGEQIKSVMELGRYFDERYPDNAINGDLSDDVRAMFPSLKGNEVYEREQTIRDGVKFYRLFKSVYQQVLDSIWVPEDPPLVLAEEDYETNDDMPYIDSPDTVVISDFKKVISYSYDAKDAKAYQEKFRQEQMAKEDRSAPIEKMKDMFVRLELKKLFLYGDKIKDPLTNNAGNGAWVKNEEQGVFARLITADSALNGKNELLAALHIAVPEGKFVVLGGADKPSVNLVSDNLAAWSVSLPIPKRLELKGNKIAGRGGDFAIPLVLKVKNPNQILNITASLSLKICDGTVCKPITLKPEISLQPGFGYSSTAENFVIQSVRSLPTDENDDLQIESAVAVSDKQGKNVLQVRLRTDENPADLMILLEDEQENLYWPEYVDVYDGYVDAVFKADIRVGAQVNVLAKWAENRAVKKLLQVENQVWGNNETSDTWWWLWSLAWLVGVMLNFTPGVWALWCEKLLQAARAPQKYVGRFKQSLVATVGGIVLSGIVLGVVLRPNPLAIWSMRYQYAGVLVLVLFIILWLWAKGAPQKNNQPNLGKGWIEGIFAVILAALAAVPYENKVLAGGYECVVFLSAGLATPFMLAAFAVGRKGLKLKNTKLSKLLELLRHCGWALMSVGLIVVLMLQMSASAGLGLGLMLGLWVFLIKLNAKVDTRLREMDFSVAEKQDISFVIKWGIRVVAMFVVAAAIWLTVVQVAKTRQQEITQCQKISKQVDVAELAAGGEHILLKVTAPWCVSCAINEALVFNNPLIEELMQAGEVKVIEANPNCVPDSIVRDGNLPIYVWFSPDIPRGMRLSSFWLERDFRRILRRLEEQSVQN